MKKSTNSTKCIVPAVVAAFIVFGVIPGKAAPVHWPIASGGNGHSYELVPASVTFASARAAAIAAGGYLVTVTSAAENSFIANNVLQTPYYSWLGGFQDPSSPAYDEPGGGWVWETGEPLVYTNWLGGEPADTCGSLGIDLGGCEDHFGMASAASIVGRWFDINAGSVLAYIVEYDDVLGQPILAGEVTTKGTDAFGFYVDVRLTNSGIGDARNIVITQVALRTRFGTGIVTYNTSLSPPLPRTVGDLAVGASITVRLYLNRPSTVTRFSIAESGTMQDVEGTNYNYSIAQSVIP